MAEWDDALEQCETILELINEDVPEEAWDKSPDFFEGIKEKVTSMSEWIEKKKFITQRMQDSLNNMERSIGRWIKN